jgi:excisionase family DNA binding protein
MASTKADDVFPKFLTVEETAKLWGVHKATVFRWIKEGNLPSVKMGRSRRIRREIAENPPQAMN